MKLIEIAAIRTGLVFSRKMASPEASNYKYQMMSLKNVTDDGNILLDGIEEYYAAEALKREYFSHDGDVLLRLSAPYSVVLITKREADLLVPAHFAIIRAKKELNPCYLHWWLTKNQKRFYQMASGGTMMGTISSGYIADMSLDPPPIELQRQIAGILELSNKEQQLLSVLSEKKKQLIDATLTKIISE